MKGLTSRLSEHRDLQKPQSYWRSILLEESDAATSAGDAIFIVRPSGVVRRLIEITDSADRLAVVPASREPRAASCR
jgi:hypothetical protein